MTKHRCGLEVRNWHKGTKCKSQRNVCKVGLSRSFARKFPVFAIKPTFKSTTGAGVEELGVVLPSPPLHHSDADHAEPRVHDVLAVACAPKPGLNRTLRRSVVGDVLAPGEPLAAGLEANGLNALAHPIVRKPAGRRQAAAPFPCRAAETGIPDQGTGRGLADAAADGAFRAGPIGQSEDFTLECACRGVLGIRRSD